MATEIISNGSKWIGEKPDTIAALVRVLAAHPLDRGMFRAFISKSGNQTRFHGNFFNVSHVFDIRTDDPAVIATLTRAIRANRRRPDFLAQPRPQKLPRPRWSR